MILQGRIVSDKEKRFLEVEAFYHRFLREVKFQGEEQINLDYQNGELKVFYLRDEVVEEYKKYLNDFGWGNYCAVNTAHKQGYTRRSTGKRRRFFRWSRCCHHCS